MDRRRILDLFLTLILIFLLVPSFSLSLSEEELSRKVREHILSNGLKVLMVERHGSPTVALQILYKVGAVNESIPKTGISHLLEHMLFKGTRDIGTTNYSEEKIYLAMLDEIYQKISHEKAKAGRADEVLLKTLQEDYKKIEEKAKSFIVKDEIGTIFLKNGGNGLNAFTGKDYTKYVVNLPSNRLELWTAIESDRMVNSVFREFYSEREVVKEERRRSYEVRPSGRLNEAFLAQAFLSHPYRNPIIGWPKDIEQITIDDLKRFYRQYYKPNNAVIAIVGDVEPEKVTTIIEKYFGTITGGDISPPPFIAEPSAVGEKRVRLFQKVGAQILIGYQKPTLKEADSEVFEIISYLLSEGRTSKFYQNLVKGKEIAQNVSVYSFPGYRYPNLFVINGSPKSPHKVEELEEAISEELEKLKREPVSLKDLEKIKRKIETGILHTLKSNQGIANQLLFYEAATDSWRDLFTFKDRLYKVTPQDIIRVAQKYLVPQNRTVAIIGE